MVNDDPHFLASKLRALADELDDDCWLVRSWSAHQPTDAAGFPDRDYTLVVRLTETA